MHIADISNPTKPWKTCEQWALKIVSEFFGQGDQEKKLNLNVSYNFDRETVNVAKS